MNRKKTLELLGTLLRTLRIQQKTAFKEIALSLDITPQAYSNIENGKTDISVIRLLEITHYFNVSAIPLLHNLSVAERYLEKQDTTQNHIADIAQSNLTDWGVIEVLRRENDFLRTQNQQLLQMLANTKGIK
jgi:transcriptional regulator with XRE-family HTH domain